MQALSGVVGIEHEDTVVAAPARQAVIVEELQEREDVLAARRGEVAGAGHGDRAVLRELADHRVAESRHRIGQEHGLGADPHELATFGERDDELAVEAEVRLERGR